jgi:hypothetical protein
MKAEQQVHSESLAAWFAEHEQPARRYQYDELVSEFSFDKPFYENPHASVFSIDGGEELFNMPLCVSLPRESQLDRTYRRDAALLELIVAENPSIRDVLPRFMGALLIDDIIVGRVFEDLTDHGRKTVEPMPIQERTTAKGLLSLYMCSIACGTHLVEGQEKWLGVYAGNFPAEERIHEQAQEYRHIVDDYRDHNKLYVHGDSKFAALIDRTQIAV